ncbi:MAG TPA: Crp/Fnr family transcriptional regulator [Actinomycetes bacterium]|nr:Crp/Fnr family transcriptional regulator [Actinomycetes bacterium]
MDLLAWYKYATRREQSNSAGLASHPPMDTQRIASALANVELFGSLEGGVVQDLADRVGANARQVKKGGAIFVQGEPANRMYLLLEGMIRLLVISDDGAVLELARHRPPAVFGEIAVLDGEARTASAEAIETSTVVTIPREELIWLLQSNADVLDALLRSLGRMVRRTTRQLTDLVFLDVEGRVARQLLLLADTPQQGSRLRTGRITQTELGEMVGGTRQTVNKALRSFKRRGFIRSAGLAFEIIDPEALRRRAHA